MRKSLAGKPICLFLFTFVINFNTHAQKVSDEFLNGCWKVKTVEFLQPTDDSAMIMNSAKGITTCFEKSKFITKMKNGNSEETVGTGSYSISPDGKTVNQKRDSDDGATDDPAEITVISDKEISFKIAPIVLFYERVAAQ